MDGWMEGRMEGRMKGWMDRSRLIDGWMDEKGGSLVQSVKT